VGFPILNDINYGGRSVGNFFGKYKLKAVSEISDSNTTNEENIEKPNAEKLLLVKREEVTYQPLSLDAENEMFRYEKFDGTKLMEIFLHSKRYTFDGRVFETEDPYWAQPDFDF